MGKEVRATQNTVYIGEEVHATQNTVYIGEEVHATQHIVLYIHNPIFRIEEESY